MQITDYFAFGSVLVPSDRARFVDRAATPPQRIFRSQFAPPLLYHCPIIIFPFADLIFSLFCCTDLLHCVSGTRSAIQEKSLVRACSWRIEQEYYNKKNRTTSRYKTIAAHTHKNNALFSSIEFRVQNVADCVRNEEHNLLCANTINVTTLRTLCTTIKLSSSLKRVKCCFRLLVCRFWAQCSQLFLTYDDDWRIMIMWVVVVVVESGKYTRRM